MEKIDMEKRKATNKKIIKVFFGIIGFLIVLTLFSKVLSGNEPQVAVKAAEPITSKKGIEGLNAVDIYLDLEKKGYTVDKQYNSKDGTLYFCDKKETAIEYNVTMFKNTSDKVEEIKISGTLTGLDNKNIIAVKPFLKYISTVQYEGSDTAKITQWIEDNFNNDKASTIIGEAKFSIFAPSQFTRLVVIEKA